MPKFSIVLPTYNSCKYLTSAIDSVLSCNYEDFEFIISNNCSDDNTDSIVKQYNDSRLNYIHPDKHLGLAAHWNFVLEHVTGEWIFGFGTDDALCPYFFELANKLTEIAENNDISIIKTNRVFYFWPGLEKIYGNKYVNYDSSNIVTIKSTEDAIKNGIYSLGGYYDVPQMYTSSMFKREVLQRAKNNNINHNIIEPNLFFPHDAYLSCVACILEKKYLYCNIPFAWVGSSIASVGYQESCSLNSAEMRKKIKNTTCNSYKTFNSTQYLLYESLVQFLKTYSGEIPGYIKDIVSNKDMLFLTILKNNYFKGHQYYLCNNKKICHERFLYFVEYAKKEHINIESLFNQLKNLFYEEPFEKDFDYSFKELIIKICEKVYNKFVYRRRRKIRLYSINKETPVSYKEINKILASSDKLKQMIKHLLLIIPEVDY